MSIEVKEATILMNSIRILLVLMPALGVACAPVQPATVPLYNSDEPGSVIVFPKFETGTVTVDGVATARTEFGLGAVCPAGATCSLHQPVRIRIQWVCPGVPKQDNLCFTVNMNAVFSVNGKLVFDTQGHISGGQFNVIPPPPCPNGYMIAWVIDNLDRPVKFDGLVGDTVIRDSGTAVATYAAIPIQADPALANYNGSNYNAAAITTSVDPTYRSPILAFDGGPGHYRPITGGTIADVEFNNNQGPTHTDTSLILLTLDARSSLPNNPTYVFLSFYNQNELLVTEALTFLCWTQVNLSDIDPNVLTQQFMTTPKGLVVAAPAWNLQTQSQVTLLGFVQTNEAPALAKKGAPTRTKIFKMFNNAQPLPTNFLAQPP
jgi:hypothetical protein